jgi:hypothetical protein
MRGDGGADLRGATIRRVREPPITLTCDCGTSASLAYGERWTCPRCGRTWNTAQIPREQYEVLLAGIRRYRLLVFGPAVGLAVILVPLAVFAGPRYAYLLFVLELVFVLMVVPPLRRRASRHAMQNAPTWRLSPE